MAWWFALGVAALCWPTQVRAQSTFELDTTFRLPFQVRNINDVLLLPDGDLVLSGGIRVEGDEELLLRGGVRVNPDGTQDSDFPAGWMMGAQLTPWQDKVYANGFRRLNLPEFSLDPTWDLINAPYISLVQYGQYHVFPDGRVLMSGFHSLSDTERGFVGSYELIWLTNTGLLDTTRVHRNANGTILRLKQTPEGKFMCYGYGTHFEGHAVPRVFRVHADGSWDSTFVAPFPSFTGYCFGFLPLADGRCYAAGQFMLPNSTDTLHLVRLMPDGSLDPTFNNAVEYQLSPSIDFDGPLLGGVFPLTENRLLVFGSFERAAGHLHRGICMIDSTGNVLPEYFPGDGCNPYNYLGSIYSSISGVTPTGDGDLYIWGAYRGYDDGMVNDTLQRLISRLHIPDLSTALAPRVIPNAPKLLSLAPNPASTWVVVSYDLLVMPAECEVLVRDLAGRVVLSKRLEEIKAELLLDTRTLSPGTYVVDITSRKRSLAPPEKLVIQQ